MSEQFNNIIYKLKRDSFYRELKRVEPYENRRPLTANVELRKEYELNLIKTYSDLTKYLVDCHENEIASNQEQIELKLEEIKKKLIQSFDILGLTYEFENDGYTLINFEHNANDDNS